MRRTKYTFLTLALVLATSSAAVARPSISTQAAPGVNFSSYKTFSLLKSEMPMGGNPVMYQEIVNDIAGSLAQKGYTQVPSGGDLTIAVTTGARNKTDIQSWGRFGFQTSVWQYTQGQLSLDAFDTKTKQAVWHGQATETIDPNKPKPEKIDAAVMKLMTQFPATAAGAASPQQ